MKKFLTLLLLTLMLGFTSCDDDKDTAATDNELSRQLVGAWSLAMQTDSGEKDAEGQPVMIGTTLVYTFNASTTFTYREVQTTLSGNPREWNVGGTWNIKRGYLQVKYDLDSFTAKGLTDAEQSALKTDMRNANATLEQLNDKDKVFGVPVTIASADGQTTLQLGNINGLFVRISF